MILFFTGSGNSEYVARVIADEIGNAVVSLNDVMKGRRQPTFSSKRPFVVCSPIHTWRLPEVVTDLIVHARFKGSKRIYFVATMEADTGAADTYCRALADQLHMESGGFTGIKMPDNCVYLDQMPSYAQARAIIRASEPRMREVARAIANGGTISKTDVTSVAGLKSGAFMHAFYKRFIETDKNYVVSDACTGCGTCVEVCPMNNITLASKDAKPIFHGNCCACYACIHHCPRAAIDIKGHSEKHGRYLCPTYQEAASVK